MLVLLLPNFLSFFVNIKICSYISFFFLNPTLPNFLIPFILKCLRFHYV